MKALVIENPARPESSPAKDLRDLGYAVDTVADGQRAIEYATRRDYDIIILDLVLPRESSLRVLHEIRESKRNVEILVLSTCDQIHDRVTALIQGADDYLVKPFSIDDLQACVQRLTERKANLPPSDTRSDSTGKPLRYRGGLIGNLLQMCGKECDEIELFISEAKLSDLLPRVASGLESVAGGKNIRLSLPVGRLPTLLVDARWMEHLLSSLLFDAIAHSPAAAEIRLSVRRERESCSIDIASRAAAPFDLKLAKTYAGYLNLGLTRFIDDTGQHRLRISNLRIV